MPDPFDGEPNFLRVHSDQVEPQWLTGEWGTPYVVGDTNIKQYSVGSPAQAVVQCGEALARQLDWRCAAAIRLRLPADAAQVVSQRASPNLDSRYLVAACLIEGQLTFARAHDLQAASQAPFADLIARTEIVPDPGLNGTRGGAVDVTLDDGSQLAEATQAPLGTRGAPLPEDLAVAKARRLISEARSLDFAEAVVDAVRTLDEAGDLSAFTRLLATAPPPGSTGEED